jgi:hypothetical protein
MRHMLLTKEIEAKLLKNPLYSTEAKDTVPVLVKFFYPYGAGSWYAVEAERQEDGDWLFFGMVDLQEKELGYFRLSELKTIQKFGRPAIERDMHFDGHYLHKSKCTVDRLAS